MITGPATNTTAGIELAERLTGYPALNLMDPASLPRLREMLTYSLPGLFELPQAIER